MPFSRILNLADVKVTKREETMLTDMMSNSPKMLEALKDENLQALERMLGLDLALILLKALALELRTKKRPATVAKLAGKLKSLLAKSIDQEIYGG